MSARGLALPWVASGDAEGAGVGRAGDCGAIELCRLGLGAVVFLLRGELDFVGEVGAWSTALVSWAKISEGSTLSPLLAFRVRTFFFGEASSFAVVCRRVVFRGLFFGAGENTSSPSSVTRLSSSCESSSSTIVFRAARRSGRAGDSMAGLFIFATTSWIHLRLKR